MAKAEVTVKLTTIGYSALEAYLKWSANQITTEDFQGTLNTLGYKLDIKNADDEIRLCKNLLTELE